MRPLLAILSYQKANDIAGRHWPWYLKSGYDILGVGRVDTDCRFPSERLIGTIKTGKDSYVCGSNLIQYHLSTIEHFLTLDGYTHLVLSEVDAIFLKPVPLVETAFPALFATHVGGNSPGFIGTRYFHGPYVMDRLTANKVVQYGRRMIDDGQIEHGFPDRWYGLLCDLHKDIQFVPWANTYSQNLIDRPQYVAEARGAIQRGHFYVHGIKTAEQLRAVTEGLV